MTTPQRGRRPLTFIQQHEQFQPRTSFLRFVADYWVQDQGTPLPDTADARGIVDAYMNHSRWVVDCPEVGCGGALVVSVGTPLFICHECGSLSNRGQWYNVTFPANRVALETELLKRSVIPVRNWDKSQTLQDLIDERALNSHAQRALVLPITCTFCAQGVGF